MHSADILEFTQLLDSTCELISRGTYRPSDENAALWTRALNEFSLVEVREAFGAHIKDPQRGRYVPAPADVIHQILAARNRDGRPSPDEAWSIAVPARDEQATVVWTQEILQAWSAAQAVMKLGDDVGARMAFREAYARLVDDARQRRVPTVWEVSEGHDPERRRLAIEAAVKLGRLRGEEASTMLPSSEPPTLLEGPGMDSTLIPDRAKEIITKFKEIVARKVEAPGLDGVAKQRTAELKVDTQIRVAAELERRKES